MDVTPNFGVSKIQLIYKPFEFPDDSDSLKFSEIGILYWNAFVIGEYAKLCALNQG